MPSYERLDYGSEDGCQIGGAATDKVALYGAVPVVQRASAFQAASVVSVSSNFTVAASLVAWALEVTNTLVGMGIWKGTA